MNLIEIIAQELENGWQVQSVWIVPPASHASQSGGSWEAHIKRADWVALGEGDSPIAVEIAPDANIPDGIRAIGREKVGDIVVELPPMSSEQAAAIAASIKRAGDATAVQKTSSGCWAIGPCAAWVRDPLRRAILAGRHKPGRPVGSTKDDSLDGVVRFRCRRAEKGAWVRQARKEGKTLTQWLRDIANRNAL